jgi:glycogen debranching enzyme
LAYGADFRDVFEVRGAQRTQRGRDCTPIVEGNTVTLRYEGLDQVVRSTVLAFSETPAQLTAQEARFTLQVQPHSRYDFYLEIGAEPAMPERRRFRAAAAKARCAMRTRYRAGARLRSSGRLFNAWLERSRADIALLVSELPTGPYPYAGIPWFSTPFGRDAIITALQTLWLDPQLARGVLAFLAQRQARETSSFQDADPGKIMHETRKGEMVAMAELPFALYYGGVDTTPLFIMLAGAYMDRTADSAFLEQLWPSLLAAAEWIMQRCGQDANGFLTYARGEKSGLANQGWKDSGDSVFHADGRMPQGPIALVEVQGYVYAAFNVMAKLARHRGDKDAVKSWRARAKAIRNAVEKYFWDDELDFYVIARDGTDEPCRVRASNAGHLLYVGLPAPPLAERVIHHLCSQEFGSGWGIRTLGGDQPRFNPMSYHNGSVWPHDVAICAAGMVRYGARGEAVRLLAEMFEAAANFNMRLPELFCGFRRMPGASPIAYPVACLPQAWAAGSVFMLLQACLGLSIDAWHNEITIERPYLPMGVDRLHVHHLDVGGSRVSLAFERVGGRVMVDRIDGDARVRIVARL